MVGTIGTIMAKGADTLSARSKRDFHGLFVARSLWRCCTLAWSVWSLLEHCVANTASSAHVVVRIAFRLSCYPYRTRGVSWAPEDVSSRLYSSVNASPNVPHAPCPGANTINQRFVVGKSVAKRRRGRAKNSQQHVQPAATPATSGSNSGPWQGRKPSGQHACRRQRSRCWNGASWLTRSTNSRTSPPGHSWSNRWTSAAR